MYRRMYRAHKKGMDRSATMPPPLTTRKVKAERCASADNTYEIPPAPPLPETFTYGERIKPVCSILDSMFWKEKMLVELREEFERLEAEKKQKEEESRIAEEELEKLTVLRVKEVDLHTEENAEKHHAPFECTEDEVDPQLVVRRGQEFIITLTFQRPWSGKEDDLVLQMTIGEEPNRRKGTMVKIKVEEGDDTSYMEGEKKKWGARLVSSSGNDVTLAVYPPPNAIIGAWEYRINSKLEQDGRRKFYSFIGKDDIIILLNPWCKDDLVYMKDEKELDEYILNAHGAVFSGSHRSMSVKPWNYAQFEDKVLEISLHLLRKAFDFGITPLMANPIAISRGLSRIINACDEDGVLVGNWSGDYSGGTAPLAWVGSKPILLEYNETREPVKYGQCWVFSHLLTTVARAIGLPCRSITNFSSAHDTDLTMTIDSYLDIDGNQIEDMNCDSVWNFHVWNEVHIRRPDLCDDGTYDSWHAIDATPQELSDNKYQCGPSPLPAIKKGELNIGYDTGFIFGEVNAEQCTWMVKSQLDCELIKRTSKRVGRKISTKIPDGKGLGSAMSRFFTPVDDFRLDVTHLYKYPEESYEERQAVEKATSFGRYGTQLFDDDECTGIQLEIVEGGDVNVGDDFTVQVKVINKDDHDEEMDVRVTVVPIKYSGGVIRGRGNIKKLEFNDICLKKGEEKVLDVDIQCDDYLKKCNDDLAMSVRAFAKLKSMHKETAENDEIRLKCPDLKIEGPEKEIDRDEECTVKIHYNNPLKKDKLTNVAISIEGSMDVVSDDFKKCNGYYKKDLPDLEPSEEGVLSVKLKPKRKPKKSKDREMDVSFRSSELPNFTGGLDFDLK